MPASDVFADAFGKLFGAADEQQADIVFVEERQFAFQVFAEESHEEFDFGFGAAPVFEREGVESEAWKCRRAQVSMMFAGGFYVRRGGRLRGGDGGFGPSGRCRP